MSCVEHYLHHEKSSVSVLLKGITDIQARTLEREFCLLEALKKKPVGSFKSFISTQNGKKLLWANSFFK